MPFTPTTEQEQALALFRTGQSIAIEAGAGTGKTAELVLMSETTRVPIQYIAFNKPIVTESKGKFPSNVRCSTAHSLAHTAIIKKDKTGKYAGRLESGQRVKSIDLANRLGIDPITVLDFAGTQRQLSRSFLAGLAMRAIEKFCQTADPAPTYKHVPLIEGLDDPLGPKVVNRDVARRLESTLRKAWADILNPYGSLRFNHHHYLKMWHLAEPVIYPSIILFDEAQDANPVMVAIVAAQHHAQIVWVGDSQQQIYSFTGAVNALASVPSDQRAFLTQSFRFGSEIADTANVVLGALDAELRVKGYEEINSVVGPVLEPDAILTRTNAAAVHAVLTRQAQGMGVHLVGGGKEIAAFARAAEKLMQGERVDHPELACFESWNEVREYVEQDEQGGDLKLMVNLIDEFGVQVILAALDQMLSEAEAEIVVSTAHKSKGRQWDSVQLGNDFTSQPRGEELRLLYVAVTRARRELDIEGIREVFDYLSSTSENGDVPAEEHAALSTTTSRELRGREIRGL